MSDELHSEIEIGSSNIFADLGLDDADELYIRACLGIQVMKKLRERHYSKKDASEVIDVKKSEISALMQAKFSRFSQERLIGFLNKLNQKVMIQVRRDERTRNHNGGFNQNSTDTRRPGRRSDGFRDSGGAISE